jgi:hypothetical protein
MRQVGSERFIGQMNVSSSSRFYPCETFEKGAVTVEAAALCRKARRFI